MPIPEVTALISGGRVASYPYTDLPKAIALSGAATNGPILDWEWTIIPDDTYNPGGLPAASALLTVTSGDFVNGRANVQNPSITLDVVGGYKFSLRARNSTGWSNPSYLGDRLDAEAIVFITTPRGCTRPPANMFRNEFYLEALLIELENTTLQDVFDKGQSIDPKSNPLLIAASENVIALAIDGTGVTGLTTPLFDLESVLGGIGGIGAAFDVTVGGGETGCKAIQTLMATNADLAAGATMINHYLQIAGRSSNDGASIVSALQTELTGTEGGIARALWAKGSWDEALYAEHGSVLLEDGGLRLTAISAPTSSVGKGWVYTKNVGAGVIELFYRDEAGNETQLTPPAAGGGTLDAGYDFGGSGAGRIIEVTDGAVVLRDIAGAVNGMLELEMGSGGDALTALALSVHHGGYNATALKAIVDDTGGSLSASEVMTAFHALLQDNTANAAALAYAFLAETDHIFPGTQTAFKVLKTGSGTWTWALDADAGSIRLLNGHLRMAELSADPSAVANQGILFIKDVAGVAELFYRDDTNTAFQLTNNGVPAGGVTGVSLKEEIIASSTTETSKVLATYPTAAAGALSGYDLQVYRNGVRMEYNASPSTLQQFNYTNGTKTVAFLNAPGSRYDFVYRA